MERKLTQFQFDLIHKILRARLTEKELAEVRAEGEKIKEKRVSPQSSVLK